MNSAKVALSIPAALLEQAKAEVATGEESERVRQ
jgi:hypothetical protein